MEYFLDEYPQPNDEQQKLLAGAMENHRKCQEAIGIFMANAAPIPIETLREPQEEFEFNQRYYQCSPPEIK